MSKIGEERATVSRLVWTLTTFLIVVMGACYFWLALESFSSGSLKAQLVGLLSFLIGCYNIVGFLLGIPILTIGGTSADYGDRLVGVVFGLVFITTSLIIAVRL